MTDIHIQSKFMYLSDLIELLKELYDDDTNPNPGNPVIRIEGYVTGNEKVIKIIQLSEEKESNGT